MSLPVCQGCAVQGRVHEVSIGGRQWGLCLDCLRGLRADVHRAIDHLLALRRTGEMRAMPDDDDQR